MKPIDFGRIDTVRVNGRLIDAGVASATATACAVPARGRDLQRGYPSRVLIAGGRETGGVASFAEALSAGFVELGLPAEVAAPGDILRRFRELRDRDVLKILSLAAVFAAPIARRALCIAHGFPCAALQGWPATLAILASLRVAMSSRGTRLVAVSDYSALHLRAIFSLRVDAVIRNPVRPLFLEEARQRNVEREAVTFVGRLHRAKNVGRLLPAIREVLDENRGLCAWIIGDGPQRTELERLARGDERIQFMGTLSPEQVRERLQRTRVFVSANPSEPFGIVYLEALSQGCAVAMPASGGGLEIAPHLIGTAIHLFPASMARGEIASALRNALAATAKVPDLKHYSARSVAEAYLAVDACFSRQGNSA